MDIPTLSPRAIRAVTSNSTDTNGDDGEILLEAREVQLKHSGIQCDIIVGMPDTGVEKQCRMAANMTWRAGPEKACGLGVMHMVVNIGCMLIACSENHLC